MLLSARERDCARQAMFNDDFDEFRARSYSGGFLCFADDARPTSAPIATYSKPEPIPTGNDVKANDEVGVFAANRLPGRVGARHHSDEVRRDHLQVEGMRPRVLSDPVSIPSIDKTTTSLQRPTPRNFHISRRGKLLCRETGVAASRPAAAHSQPRRRAKSASACELDERRRRRTREARSSERSRPLTPLAQHLSLAQHTAPPSPNAPTLFRVMVAGSSGVGKSTVLTQLFHAAYVGEIDDQGLQGRHEQCSGNVSLLSFAVGYYRRFGHLS